jgi:hypothetical protein
MKTGTSVSGGALLEFIGGHLKKVPDHRDPWRIEIPLKDFLMSGFAMFSLKFPSLLQFEEEMRAKKRLSSELTALYQISRVPSDTQFRAVIDEIDPTHFRPIFRSVFSKLQRSKHLEDFKFYDGKYLLSVDGTEYFSSKNVKCRDCMKKTLANDTTYFYHQMLAGCIVHPEKRQVIPLMPEPILKQDGKTKNDSERNAIRRFLNNLRASHPKIELILVADALHSTGPLIRDLKHYNMNFILGVKPGSHEKLFAHIERKDELGELSHVTVEEEIGDNVKKKRVHHFRYTNAILLNDSDVRTTVNYIEYWETTQWVGKGGRLEEKKVHFSWVTDFTVTHHNVMQIMRGGRARWKIENETFNTLKNQGYEFEHNFGHGYKNLSTNLAMMMFLVFLFDQLQEIGCKDFQNALAKNCGRRSYLWRKLRSLYEVLSEYDLPLKIQSWSDFLIKLGGAPPAPG